MKTKLPHVGRPYKRTTPTLILNLRHRASSNPQLSYEALGRRYGISPSLAHYHVNSGKEHAL